jgi:hypothetical protein
MGNDLLIRSHLKRLRLPVIAQNYTRLSKEAAAHNQTFQDYLLALLEGEVVQRDENAQKLRLSRHIFPSSSYSIALILAPFPRSTKR